MAGQLNPPPSPVEALFGVLPLRETNPLGGQLVQTWCQIIEKVLPGEIPELNENGQGHDPTGPVRDLYFLYPMMPAQKLLDGVQTTVVNQLGAGWWANYSTALVTQAVYNIAATTQPTVDAAAIAADLKLWNPALRQSALSSYSLLFDTAYAPAIAATGSSDHSMPAYLAILTSPAWIAAKQAAFSDGQWPDSAWELFHHAIKLLALGATDHDVTGALWTLEEGGLTMPPDVKAENWLDYRQFIGDPPLLWSNLSADGRTDSSGSLGFQATSYTLNLANPPQRIYPEPEGVSHQFVKMTKYFLPSGSCFSPSTRVLLPGGIDRAIRDLAPGDLVWTPVGPRRLRVAPRVVRNRRSLYQINGCRFAFSDSHPFVDGSVPDASLAMHLPRAAAFCGGLSKNGLRLLAPGAVVAAVDRDGMVAPCSVDQIREDGSHDDEDLIDLILEPAAEGFPSYAVGDGGAGPFFLVRPETLRFEERPLGAAAGLALLFGSQAAVHSALAQVPLEAAARIPAAVRRIRCQLLDEALRTVAAADRDVLEASSKPLHEAVDMLLDACYSPAEGSYDWRLGALLEALVAELLVPMDHIVASGWRVFEPAVDGTTHHAITLHEVTGIGDRLPGGDWTLNLAIGDDPAGSMALGVDRAGSDQRDIGWTVVVPRRPTLNLDVRLAGPHDRLLHGRTTLLGQPPAGYLHGSVLMRAREAGSPEASILFDVRLLGDAAATGHPSRAPDSWDDVQRAAFAVAFGSALASRFSALFPMALGVS